MSLQVADPTGGSMDAPPPRHRVERGFSHPLGAHLDAGGVNFAIFSEHATGMQLLLFDSPEAAEPYQIITLDPEANRSFAIWHAHVEGLRAPAFYGLRVFGPEGAGMRFDPDKVLLDPYARGVDRSRWQRGAACAPGDNTATSLRSVVVADGDYDWAGDEPLCRPMEELVVYEMHVGGFTRSPSSGVAERGTFAGVVEKIPHLKALGITAVELMPVFDFDDGEARTSTAGGSPTTGVTAPPAFFAPHAGYCVTPESGGHLTEFRDMVKALHAAGIEVILDVVFNHTDEGNELGPLFSFAGLDNPNYYYLDPADPRYYYDYSGCGNTVMANHPIVTKMIVECLGFWVRDMHVDGFRFDLAAVLTRGDARRGDGRAAGGVADRALRRAGRHQGHRRGVGRGRAYQVGRFPGYRWAEWNGRYRDTMRRFVRGEPGIVGDVAARLAGSADLYQAARAPPGNSVNFVTCHDGFTLERPRVVRRQAQRGQRRGQPRRQRRQHELELRRRGTDRRHRRSSRAAGAPDQATSRRLLLLSRGRADDVAGDEIGRTQRGNNNAYCQDNEIGWVDWSLVDANPDLLRFWQRLIAFRRANRVLWRPTFYLGQDITLARHPARRPRLGRPERPHAGLHPDRHRRRPGPARHREHVLGAARVRTAGGAGPIVGPGRRHRPAHRAGHPRPRQRSRRRRRELHRPGAQCRRPGRPLISHPPTHRTLMPRRHRAQQPGFHLLGSGRRLRHRLRPADRADRDEHLGRSPDRRPAHPDHHGGAAAQPR